jgi:hypothetical protein
LKWDAVVEFGASSPLQNPILRNALVK